MNRRMQGAAAPVDLSRLAADPALSGSSEPPEHPQQDPAPPPPRDPVDPGRPQQPEVPPIDPHTPPLPEPHMAPARSPD